MIQPILVAHCLRETLLLGRHLCPALFVIAAAAAAKELLDIMLYANQEKTFKKMKEHIGMDAKKATKQGRIDITILLRIVIPISKDIGMGKRYRDGSP